MNNGVCAYYVLVDYSKALELEALNVCIVRFYSYLSLVMLI
jgi:hypothetical protein